MADRRRAMTRAALGALLVLGASAGALRAQALGPQRQFLAVEPYYSRLELDAGSGESRLGVNGYGARLWINLAQFAGPLNGSIALFTTFYPDQADNGVSALHYGAQYDQFFVRRPFGGIIDPLISLGAGAFGFEDTASDEEETKFALTPGVGIRIPIPNRFQLRFDARDAIIFGTRDTDGSKRTANNFEFIGAIGITF